MNERLRRRPLVTGLIIGIVAGIALFAVFGFLFFPQILKHRTDLPFEDALGTNRVRAAIPRADRRAANPLPVTAGNIAAGHAQYAANCVICHGADGRGDTPIGRNMYPRAANLLSPKVRDMTQGEIAWIARNGLSFVGMPAFGTLLTDEQIWQTVMYIESLQQGGPAGAAAPGQLAAGQALFAEIGCASCHGAEAGGGVGPALAGIRLPFDRFHGIVRNGRESMPSFPPAAVSDDQLQQIYDWLSGAR